MTIINIKKGKEKNKKQGSSCLNYIATLLHQLDTSFVRTSFITLPALLRALLSPAPSGGVHAFNKHVSVSAPHQHCSCVTAVCPPAV